MATALEETTRKLPVASVSGALCASCVCTTTKSSLVSGGHFRVKSGQSRPRLSIFVCVPVNIRLSGRCGYWSNRESHIASNELIQSANAMCGR